MRVPFAHFITRKPSRLVAINPAIEFRILPRAAFPVPFFDRPKPKKNKFPDRVGNGCETTRIFLLDSFRVGFDPFEHVGGDASRDGLELFGRFGAATWLPFRHAPSRLYTKNDGVGASRFYPTKGTLRNPAAFCFARSPRRS